MLSPELCATLAERYNLHPIGAAYRLEGGYRNLVLRIETGNGILVVRISHPATTVESIAYEHALLRYISARVPQVPAPLAAVDGSTWFDHGGRLVTLFPFMPGRIADRGRVAVRAGAARMLAQLHRAALEYPHKYPRPGHPALRDLDWVRNTMWAWPAVYALLSRGADALVGTPGFGGPGMLLAVREIVARLPQIEREREVFRAFVAELAASDRSLLFSPIQGDYYRGNLLVDGDQISAVLDWDECHPEWLSWELGRATWEFCKDEAVHTLDEARAHMFLGAYLEAGGPVPMSEFDMLVPFMRCVRLQEVLAALGDALRGEAWDPEYTLHNLLALEHLQHARLFS